MDFRTFQPIRAGTIVKANAVAASSGTIPNGADTIVVTNTSATAYAYLDVLHVDPVIGSNITPAVVPAVGTLGAMPIPPGTQSMRLYVGPGNKQFSVIASAADGNLLIAPGKGF